MLNRSLRFGSAILMVILIHDVARAQQVSPAQTDVPLNERTILGRPASQVGDWSPRPQPWRNSKVHNPVVFEFPADAPAQPILMHPSVNYKNAADQKSPPSKMSPQQAGSEAQNSSNHAVGTEAAPSQQLNAPLNH